jgi:hypothetical protein
MNLLFINDKILDIDLITSNLLNTNHVLFNQATDTYDSLIQKIPSGNYTNVGILQDNPFTGKYTFLDSFGSSIVKDVASLDPELASWTNFLLFVNYLKTIGMTSLHFLQCNEVSVDWNYLKTKFLENQVSIEFSLNKTGLGGDWILESSNLNLVGLYFTEGILNYPHSFGVVTFGPGLDYIGNFAGDSIRTSVKIITKEKGLIFWGCNRDNNFSIENIPVNNNQINLLQVNNNYYFSPDITTIVNAINQAGGVINVAGSEEMTIVVLKNGTVWACGINKWLSTNYGSNPNGFIQINGTGRNEYFGIDLDMGTINKISYSNGYTFYLNIDGDVYSTTWEYSDSSGIKERLGVNATSNVNGITKITGIPPIRDVQSGVYRTTFISTDNKLYICGSPDSWSPTTHALGILNVTSVSAPRKLTTSEGLPFDVPIKSVSSGMTHSFALDMSGNIWVWGSIVTASSELILRIVRHAFASNTTSDTLLGALYIIS